MRVMGSKRRFMPIYLPKMLFGTEKKADVISLISLIIA